MSLTLSSYSFKILSLHKYFRARVWFVNCLLLQSVSCTYILYFQSLCLPKTQEPLDLGLYAPPTSTLGHGIPGPAIGSHSSHTSSFGLHGSSLGHTTHGSHGNISNTSTGSLPGLKEEDKPEQPKDTQFLSANCVLMTYYNGDISATVDEHFSRALSQPSSYSPDGKNSKGKNSVLKLLHI